MDRFTDFLNSLVADTYPEPRTPGHDKLTVEWLEKVAGKMPAGTLVLDVGCGQGPALEWFKQRLFRAQGISTNADDVAECNRRGFYVTNNDQHDTGAADCVFDLVWARHVIEHSPAPLYALKEWHRVLKPGGTLYVEVPAPGTSCCHETNQNHYSVLGHQMWLSLLNKANFKVQESTEIQFKTPAGPDKYWNFICQKP